MLQAGLAAGRSCVHFVPCRAWGDKVTRLGSSNSPAVTQAVWELETCKKGCSRAVSSPGLARPACCAPPPQ